MTGVGKRKLFLPLAATAAVVLAGSLVVAQFSSSASAQAASPSQPARCSLATLNGTYVFSQNGVQLTGNNPGPLALAGTIVFDGRGHAHGLYSVSLNGNIVRHLSFTNTYTLNPDCTGTETVPDSTGAVRHYDAYTSPSGSQLMHLQTDPGSVVTGVAEKR